MKPKKSRITIVARQVRAGFNANVDIYDRSSISVNLQERPWDLINWHLDKLTHSQH